MLAMLAMLAVVAVVAAGAGCRSAPPRRTDAVAIVHVDLIEELARVEGAVEPDTIAVDSPEARRFLRGGWYPPQTTLDGRRFVWLRGGVGVIDLPLVWPAVTELELVVEPFTHAPRLPSQGLLVLWNGHEVANLVMEPQLQVLRLSIPSELQRVGMNRLELRPAWRAPAAALAGQGDRRALSMRLFSLRLSRLPRRDAPTQAPVVRDGAQLLQAPGSVLTLPLLERSGAVLELETVVDWPSACEGQEAVEVSLSVSTGEGEHRLLWSDRAGCRQAPTPATARVVLPRADAMELLFSARRVTGAGGALADVDVRVRWKRVSLEFAAAEDPAPDPLPASVAGRYPNILMVVFDTLRADAASPWGAPRRRTPVLDALSRRGLVFDAVFADASWTRASVASLLSGLPVAGHGVDSIEGVFPPDAPDLVCDMAAAGRTTVAISNNGHVSEVYGLERCFDHFYDYFEQREQVLELFPDTRDQADLVWEDYLEPALSEQPERPFFVYLHEIDPHAPYQVAEQVRRELHERLPSAVDLSMPSLTDQFRHIDVSNGLWTWQSAADVELLRGGYHAEVAAMDAYLGRLLERLRQSGRDRDTLLVFLSDHGEEFGEHGYFGHGRSVYEPALRVPLLIAPASEDQVLGPRRIDQPLELSDVRALLGAWTGVQAATPRSRSRQGAAEPPELRIAHALPHLYPEFSGRSVLGSYEALRWGDWKLHRRSLEGLGDYAYDFELYDLAEDPGETVNRWSLEPVLGRVLEATLDAFSRNSERAAATASGARSIDDVPASIADNLRSLGYIE